MDSKPSVVPLWIDGRSAAARPAVTFPISPDEQGNTAFAQSADVDAAKLAAAAAKKAFEQWRLSSPTSRRDILLRAAGLLDSRRAELVALQVLETNCAEAWAQFNIDNSINNMREISARITSACTGSIPAIGGEKNLGLVFKEPVGPVLLIAP
jgi:acyl-CoA reductase-like NAD-dependent aldehyde dehydrogenase